MIKSFGMLKCSMLLFLWTFHSHRAKLDSFKNWPPASKWKILRLRSLTQAHYCKRASHMYETQLHRVVGQRKTSFKCQSIYNLTILWPWHLQQLFITWYYYPWPIAPIAIHFDCNSLRALFCVQYFHEHSTPYQHCHRLNQRFGHVYIVTFMNLLHRTNKT